MECFHPDCPMTPGRFADWQAAANAMQAAGLLSSRDIAQVGAALADCPPLGTEIDRPALSEATLSRLLGACPCLYTQIDRRATADAVVHLCEITLGERIVSINVERAFAVQYPAVFAIPPRQNYGNAGAISEALCAEVLTNEGLPPMPVVRAVCRSVRSRGLTPALLTALVKTRRALRTHTQTALTAASSGAHQVLSLSIVPHCTNSVHSAIT
jgi:hypothetical protein